MGDLRALGFLNIGAGLFAFIVTILMTELESIAPPNFPSSLGLTLIVLGLINLILGIYEVFQ